MLEGGRHDVLEMEETMRKRDAANYLATRLL